MNWWRDFVARYRWSWVGTVEGKAIHTDDAGKVVRGGNQSSYWNLYERGDGKRRAALIADHFVNSHAARITRAEVKAWEKGGPLPDLYKAHRIPKPAAKLIAFPGGKDGAA
jgi:hypothetical protein